MIDAHTHLGVISAQAHSLNEAGLTAEQMVDRMNRCGIDRAVLLPLDSPEASICNFTNQDCLAAYRRFPERFLPFCCVDPRRPDAPKLLPLWKERGCLGFGEHKTGLAIDDPRSKELYKICGELGWPVLIHIDHLIHPRLNWDEPGLPRLQRLVEELPGTIFIMHGPGWWSEISAKVEEGVIYPEGPIEPGGAADRLLSEAPNIYADLSAHSGYNALTRDPNFTEEFLDRNWRKLLFGTDYLCPGQECPIVDWIKRLEIEPEKREAIEEGNLLRILGRGKEKAAASS